MDIRRLKVRLISIFKELNHLAPSNIDHLKLPSDPTTTNRHSRSYHPQNLQRITVNKDCYKFSLYPYTIPEWNSLPANVKEAPTLSQFKIRLGAIDLDNLSTKAHFTI